MEFVYVLCGSEWEDIIIYLSKEEAIKESIKHPNHRLKFLQKVTH